MLSGDGDDERADQAADGRSGELITGRRAGCAELRLHYRDRGDRAPEAFAQAERLGRQVRDDGGGSRHQALRGAPGEPGAERKLLAGLRLLDRLLDAPGRIADIVSLHSRGERIDLACDPLSSMPDCLDLVDVHDTAGRIAVHDEKIRKLAGLDDAAIVQPEQCGGILGCRSDGLQRCETGFHQERQFAMLGEAGDPERRRAGVRAEPHANTGIVQGLDVSQIHRRRALIARELLGIAQDLLWAATRSPWR
jgi:hypothetical protein